MDDSFFVTLAQSRQEEQSMKKRFREGQIAFPLDQAALEKLVGEITRKK
jgi:hypothetical protein